MKYINVGARMGGERIKTKKALKEAVLHNPERVVFDKTSAFDGLGTIDLEEVSQGVTLQVCGPDPHTDRKWHASIKRIDGAITVS